ncbi:MAG: hypothetical protein RLZZ165_1218 [Bacteroidota bacterium]
MLFRIPRLWENDRNVKRFIRYSQTTWAKMAWEAANFLGKRTCLLKASNSLLCLIRMISSP